MREIICIISIVLIPVLLKGSAELDTWNRNTPGGNKFTHERCCTETNRTYNNNIACRKNNSNKYIIVNVKRWYFYKNCIIGEFWISTNDEKINYFIFSERTCEVEEFESESKFTERLKSRSLKPFIRRYYTESWGVFNRYGEFDDVISFFFLKVPILVIFSITVVVVFIRTKIDFKLRANKLILLLLLLIFVRWVLDVFPQSI